MSERLDNIDVFVLAVTAGSFAQAAERLRLTRSAVAKSIARLEHRLGVRLFHRTTRSQSLTEDGRAYYERCVRALAELDAAEAAFDTRRNAPKGRLRVSAPVVFGRHCVAPILLQLARQHPALTIEMSFSDRVVDLVEEGFDLAVRIGTLRDSATIAARRLGAQHMGICASPAYLAERGRPSTAADFSTHESILYARVGQPVPWRVRDGGEILDVRTESRLCFDDLQAIADAAVAGSGLAWLPCWLLARYVRSGELTLVMDSERVVATSIHAVWPQTIHLPSKTRAAIDALVANIPGLIGIPAGRATHAAQSSIQLGQSG
jgi:DNA-binding transcriptional LysR family regulator